MEIASAAADPRRCSEGSELDSIGDFLGIDDLLDFSHEEIAAPAGDNSAELVSWPFKTVHTPSILLADTQPAGLCVPCDDIAELEWLSNFVEESFSSDNAFMNAVRANMKPNNGGENEAGVKKKPFQSASPVSVLKTSQKQGCFNPDMAIRGRARSKRSRAGHTIWGTLIFSAVDTAANIVEPSSSSTTTATASSSPDMDILAFEQQAASPSIDKGMKSSTSKLKKLVELAQTRRCLHCASQKTPQWRAGPMGPKTLCNACGVRFKSGRLFPEYRPAASPTFVEALHSNSHRRVLEMRRHKQESAQGEEEPLLWQQVAGCGGGICLVNAARLEEEALPQY